jgi:hypothetical protein
MARFFGTAAAVAFAVVVLPRAASAACLTDAEIEATIGAQVRSGAFALNTGPLADRPLCSGLTLAQRIQQMHDAAFPRERAIREQQAAELRRQDDLARQQEEADRAAAAAARPPEPPAPVPHAPRSAPALAAQPDKPLVITTAALGISLDTLLDRLVQADSQSWMVNHYVRGSMHNAHYLSSNKAHTTYTAYGDYSFQGYGGSAGWVKARVANGALECLEFWDQPGNCRALYHSLSQQNFVSGVASMMTDDGGGSGPARRNDYDPDIDRRNRQNDSSPPPPPPPVTPIGGAGGLYGCASPPCM